MSCKNNVRRVCICATVLGLVLATQLWSTREFPLSGALRVVENVVSANPSNGEFYGGYKKLQCNSCPEEAELENPKAPLGFVIGVQKSGTTNLLQMLDSHPNVAATDKGELHTLDRRWTEEFGGPHSVDRCNVMRNYNELLSNSTEGAGIVDKSPSYILSSEIVPQRIMCAFPNAKIVILLRNPVDRCFSHFHATMRWKPQLHDATETFDEHVTHHLRSARKAGLLNANLTAREEYKLWSKKPNMPDNFIARGLYALQIRQWMAVMGDHFGWDKLWDHLLILEAEEVWKDEVGHLDRIQEFLDLPPFHHEAEPPAPAKEYSNHMSDATRTRLEAVFQPHNQKLDELLSPHGIHISWAKAQ